MTKQTYGELPCSSPDYQFDSTKPRCHWLDSTKADYVDYHDNEWGEPVHDDRMLFEYLILEAAQAGLSWYTVLKKRAAYRDAFDDFDVEKVAAYTEADVERLVQNAGIIRNKLKINASINNAKKFIEIQKEFGSFDQYIWQFVNHQTIYNRFENLEDYPATSAESDAMSKDLKKRGFKFVGSTICYAFMQAAGMVNDHQMTCFKYHHK